MANKYINKLFLISTLFITSCIDNSTKILTPSVNPTITPTPVIATSSPVTTPIPTPSLTIESVKPVVTSTPIIPNPTNTPIVNNEEQRNLTIKAIIDNRCGKCHSGIKLGGYDFKELSEVINSKSTIKGVVKSKRMPPNNNMTQEERNSIESW